MRVATVMVLAAIGSACALGACGEERFPREIPDAGPPTFDSGFAPLEPAPPPKTADAALRDASSSPVVFDALRGGVWTANGDAGSISYVDVDTRKVVQEIAIGKDVRSVALSPDARWIAAVDRAGATVSLLDAETREVKKVIAVGTHPRAAVWDAHDPRWLYVALEDDGAVAILDRTLGTLARTVSVGRIPAGLAVSRLRRELYVTHRIDARVTVVSLEGVYTPADQNAALVEIGVADEAATEDPKVPHGKPFAFESLAFAADGKVAWLPHELFAPTHPFQFQSTLFPAISVVDLAARAEVQTDPADPNGAIAGRKNLFAAINLIDPTGNPHVVSQPCAAALHPNGFVGYALACASEDLLTFDIKTGLAVDILRNLPVDHPVGMALDDTGQRVFVIADQSHSLVTLDTGNGSVLTHARIYGDPIALAAKDPVDAKTREGLKLFFRASSSKGDLATTGNNWMSCGGCHLDGFVSTNQLFFEAAKIADPTKSANIGHEGLKDLFSSAPTPDAVDPHDILVAFTEQGGLAPDRTGANREGAIDPSNASSSTAALDMAKNIARVIQRDLPIGPTWLLPGDPQPNANNDGAWCGNCHKLEYDAWTKSVHAHSSVDPMVRFGVGIEQKLRGNQYSRLCAGCHDPVSARLGDVSLDTTRGVSCLGCHDTERLIRAGGNGDLEMQSHTWEADHRDRAKAGLVKLRDPAFCGGCHQQFVPGTGLEAITTHTEWQKSPYSGGANPATPCVDCHLPITETGAADHTMIGGNVYMAKTVIGDTKMAEAEAANLVVAIGISAVREGSTAKVTVRNRGAGHSFPTGVSDIREPWVELQAVDDAGKVIARYGGPDASGLIPADAARLGMDIAKADGTILYLHELSETTSIPFDVRVPAAGAITLTLPIPASLPSGATKWSVVLLYRNVRTPYYRAATGDAQSSAPETEVGRVGLP